MQYMAIIIGVVLLAGLMLPGGAYAAVRIGVPFASQAPSGVWTEPWQNFCEEASVVMAAHFIWGYPLTAKFADIEMHIIKTFEDAVFKRYKDTTVGETALILKELFRFRTNVSERSIASPDDIKNELRAGRILIVPLAGQALQNPYFRAPGPLYHMLVIRGFDDARGTFITNDPGTRNGEGFEYPQWRLFDAIHDWNNGDVIKGKKTAIVISR